MGYALRRIRLLCWGGKFAVEGVAMLPWNRRQVCYGISGKFGVELVATFIWNWWQLSHGIRTQPQLARLSVPHSIGVERSQVCVASPSACQAPDVFPGYPGLNAVYGL